MNQDSRSRLTVAVADESEARLVRLSGEFDLAGVGTFERQLSTDRGPGAKTTIIDLRDLRFMDSSGLRALIRAESDLREEGGRVVVIKSSGQVAELLNLTGVAERLEMADEIPSELGMRKAG
jgi:anti-sigma B factor antagonist